ncbi:hypothetical protein ABG067_003833 [Albugo candida]
MVRMTHNPIRLVCHEWRVAATFAHKRIFFGSSSSRNGFYIACVPVSSIFDMLSNFNEELQSATSNALIEISPGRIPKKRASFVHRWSFSSVDIKSILAVGGNEAGEHIHARGSANGNRIKLIPGPKITLSLFRIMTNSCHQRDDWGIFWRNGSTMHGYLLDAISDGPECALDGSHICVEMDRNGNFVRPTILINVSVHNIACIQEIFVPVL